MNSDRYWRSLEEREHRFEADAAEFRETQVNGNTGPDRRGFLKAAGFSFATAITTACSRTAPKITPNLKQPEGFIPGRSVQYASVCRACSAGCGALVKVRDGRPIRLEGSPDHPLSRGGLCMTGQASLLGLYDSRRIAQPSINGKSAHWNEIDNLVRDRLDQARRTGGRVRILTGTTHGSAESKVIRDFADSIPNAQHISHDSLSCSAILDAYEATRGARIFPRYRFDKADVIVSIDADFLGTWVSPVEYTEAYSVSRDPGTNSYAWHAHIESRLSITGSKADKRIVLAPADFAAFVRDLRRAVNGDEVSNPDVLDIAHRLRAARGKSLVVCGVQEVAAQSMCIEINDALGNYGATIDIEHPSRQRQGSDRDIANLLGELRDGVVDVLLVAGVNPVYELPGGDAITRAKLLIAYAERPDETVEKAHVICAAPHALESWGDAEPLAGIAAVAQPCLQPLHDTRPLIESLGAWSGRPDTALDRIRQHWRAEIYPRSGSKADFESFWERALQDGFAHYEPGPQHRKTTPTRIAAVESSRGEGARDEFTLVLYAKPALLDGRHAYNPWLQEAPDPLTKVAWDNYACLAPAAAAAAGVRDGDVVRVECDGQCIELPALVQPGQHERIVAIALGYGSSLSARFAKVGPQWLEARPTVNDRGLVGVNSSPLLRFEQGYLQYSRSGVRLSRTGKTSPLACTQEHHSVSVPERLTPVAGARRPIIQETTIDQVRASSQRDPDPPLPELWPPDHPYTSHRWAIIVDLNACTGCSACVIACQAENNIPVVGKDEMRRNREMHWIRIDRYYSGDPKSPRVAHQPMFCQQCEHAPCETVCPVLATAHSDEGLNQQIYNRCVGTRYCANNCPYKVRRFNWFNYVRDDRLANLVLNPDVTVRSRGVMEKCTFCVHRIQEGKIEAKRLGQAVRDGYIQTACQQSCPARAITFGDLNDPSSRASRLMASGRRYRVLEEINVRPSVGYLKIVRHDTADGEEKENG